MEEQESFFTRLDGRVAAIEEAWARLKAGWDADRLQALYQRVCEISEGSGHLSLFQLNEGAFSLEVYLSSFVDTPKIPSADQIAEIDGLVRSLQAAASESPTTPPERTEPTEAAERRSCSRTLYALLSALSPAHDLVEAIQRQGCQLRTFGSVDEMLEAMNLELPALILTDTGQLDHLPPLSSELQRLSTHEALDIPLVFVSDYSLLSVRVAAMRAGASAYFVTPVDPTVVAEQLAQLATAEKEETPYRVTVVEDDPAQAEFAGAVLRKAGMEVDLVTEPLALVEALQAFHPDLILMDIYMPEVNGLELTRIIRDFNEFVTTPIVFLSGERDTNKQMDALSFGGDDFIAKPIEPRRLISMVTHRIRRSRRLHAALSGGGRPRGRDQVTGLLSRSLFRSHTAEVLDGSASGPACSALLYLRPDALIELQSQIGIGGLDALIAQTGDRLKALLAPHDQASRSEEHGLLVLLRRDAPEELAEAGERIRAALTGQPHPAGLEPVLFSAGLYRLERADESLDSALRLAARACDAAVQQGGDRLSELAEPAAPASLSKEPPLENILRDALQNDSFGVYYQPLLDLQTRGSENYEILLALTGSDGSTLTWRKLTEPAQRAGLQAELDRWVLSRALDILIERRNSGRQTQIFVRQSLASAGDPAYPEWVAEQLLKRQAQGIGLVLDFALSDLSQDVKAAYQNRQALEDLGVQLAISRFVAKPAAYKILRYLRADYVRVARKLLKADRATISSLIAEAHRLDARVIVSNVDDPRAIDLHWSSGADYLQGNFIQRPLEDMDYDFSQVVM